MQHCLFNCASKYSFFFKIYFYAGIGLVVFVEMADLTRLLILVVIYMFI